MKKLITILAMSLLFVAPTTFALGRQAADLRAERATEIQARIQELKTAREDRREELKTQLTARLKTKALAEIDRIVARYQRVKDRVQNMKVISDELKLEVAQKIDTQVELILAYKPTVEAATTPQEIRTVMQELKAKVRTSVGIVREVVNAIHATHLTNIVERLNTVITKLEPKAGNSTENLNLIAEAKTALETATTKITAKEFKAAKDSILEARKSLVELAQNIKAASGEEE